MFSIRIAANYIPGTAILTGGWDRSGHLQIVYDDDNPNEPLVEAEIQPDFPFPLQLAGGWQFQPFGQLHGDPTPYIADDDTIENADRYDITTVSLQPYQTAEKVWLMLEHVHNAIEDAAPNLEYDANQNSNSYVRTALYTVGIDLGAYLATATPADVRNFPGAETNILLGSRQNSVENVPINLNLSGENAGTSGADFIRTGIGNDTIEGSGGNDVIIAGRGNDMLMGGDDFDTYNIAQSGDGVDTITDTDGQGQIVITDGTNQPLFSIAGNATSISGGTGGNQLYEIPSNNIKLEYNPTTKVLNVIDWKGKGSNDKIIINDFDSGELGINTASTSLSFIQDFVTGSTQDTQIVFDIERQGDTTFPIEIFVDGDVTQGSAFFTDFNYTLPAGDSPQLVITASVSEVFGDVAFEFEIDAINPDSSVVNIIDGTASGILFGDRVDDRGGQIFGDPHFITFDNVAFDFQAAGDFVLTRATSGPDYEVQARFSALSSAVSVTTAMATKVDGITISLQTDGSDGDLLIDGSNVNISDGDSIAVGGGSVSRNGRKIDIDHGNGDTTSVDVFSSFMNVTPAPSLARAPGSLEGLLGDGDGNPGDDFQLADGTVLSTPIPIDILYGSYANSWLVADNKSILPGTAEQFDAPDRIITIDSLPDTLRQAAETAVNAAGITNPILREAVILDFALTGNAEFIEAAELTDDVFNPIVDTVAVDPINSPVVILTTNRTEFDEADPATHTATLTVSRGSTEGDLTVNYNIIGTGASPADADDFINNISGAAVINDGEDSATFTVEIDDDLLDEGSEEFDVTIALDGAQASSYELLVSSVHMTILDDDEAPGLNEIIGTEASDYLVGTDAADIIHSQGGSYDRSTGGLGADIFAFGAEALNGIRERDVIMDYEVGIDAILLEDGATVGLIRQTSTGAAIFLEGDFDAIYVQGEGVLPGNLTFVPENILLG